MSNLGMVMTTFFTFAVRQAVREQALPFRHRLINGNYDKKTYQFAMKNTKYNNDGKTVVEKMICGEMKLNGIICLSR